MPFSASRNHRLLQVALLAAAVIGLAGAGDDSARFSDLGHRMMCVCGCNQILLECNHVGCQYSDRMRGELMASLDRGDNDDLALQAFVQKYGTTVLAAPTNKGFNRVAWIIPYVVLLLGLAMTMAIVRLWRGRQTAPVIVGRPGDAALDSYRHQAQQETEL
jgi:cytochrome c-type biogenesis protein CcmH